MPVALVAPERHLTVTPVCSARTLAEGAADGHRLRPAGRRADLPCPTTPSAAWPTSLDRAARHARAMAERSRTRRGLRPALPGAQRRRRLTRRRADGLHPRCDGGAWSSRPWSRPRVRRDPRSCWPAGWPRRTGARRDPRRPARPGPRATRPPSCARSRAARRGSALPGAGAATIGPRAPPRRGQDPAPGLRDGLCASAGDWHDARRVGRRRPQAARRPVRGRAPPGTCSPGIDYPASPQPPHRPRGHLPDRGLSPHRRVPSRVRRSGMPRASHSSPCSPPPAPSVTAAAPAAAQSTSDTQRPQALLDGPSGRFLMDGPWLRRLDPQGVGERERWQRQRRRRAGRPITVPNAWNATDESEAAFLGGVGWYRKDFRPRARPRALAWVVRFESVNYRAASGSTAGRSAEPRRLPALRDPPAARRCARRANRLVVRVDNRRKQTDFPPSGSRHRPAGRRLVELRRAAARGLPAADRPTRLQQRHRAPDRLPCATSTARRRRLPRRVRNYGDRARRVRVAARASAVAPVDRHPPRRPGRLRDLHAATSRVGARGCGRPADPFLYDASLPRARAGARSRATRCTPASARSRLADGRLLLNGPPLNFRGVGVHEDSRAKGFAIDNATATRRCCRSRRSARRSSAATTRSPLLPGARRPPGPLQWSEIPVYSVKTQYLAQRLVRQLAAPRAREQHPANGNHPSVIVWSIGNELSARPGPGPGLLHPAAPRRAPSAWTRRARRPRRRRLPARRLPPATRRSTSSASTSTSAGTRPRRPDRRPRRAAGVPRPVRACYPRQGDRRLGVRRRGQPRRPGGGEGHVRPPAGLRQLPPRRLRDEAVAVGRDLLDPAGVPRPPELGRRQPAAELADPPEGRDRFDGAPKPAFFDLQRLYRATPQIGARR